jgi:hypothetical protein
MAAKLAYPLCHRRRPRLVGVGTGGGCRSRDRRVPPEPSTSDRRHCPEPYGSAPHGS